MTGEWKLDNDGESAVSAGTPFRVAYFVGTRERFLYFRTQEEAFAFVQGHPTAEDPEIMNLRSRVMLFPEEAR